MKKLLLLFTLFLLYGCDGSKTYKKVVGIDEDLYIKSVYVVNTGGGRTPFRQYYRYVVGPLLKNDTVFIISGEEIIENGQPSIYKLGDKLLEGRR